MEKHVPDLSFVPERFTARITQRFAPSAEALAKCSLPRSPDLVKALARPRFCISTEPERSSGDYAYGSAARKSRTSPDNAEILTEQSRLRVSGFFFSSASVERARRMQCKAAFRDVY
jgi:hypothetical protein